MNGELVPAFEGVLNDKPELLVNARLLHQFLEVGRDFSNWIKGRIEQYGFVEELDYLIADFSPDSAKSQAKTGEQVEEYSPVSASIPRGRGQPRIDYHLSMDMAKELALVENNDKGRQVRRYFIRMEDRARNTIPSIGVVRVFGLRHPDARLSPEKRQALLESRPDWLAIYPLVMKGMNGNEIADLLGQAKTTVYNKISRMRMCGILPPHPRRVGIDLEMEMREDKQKQEMQQWQALPGAKTDT